MDEQSFLVLELYSNPNEYSSAHDRIPVVRAVCTDIDAASEIIALKKIADLQNIIDEHASGKKFKSFVQNLFVVSIPNNNLIDILTYPKVQISENNLTDETRKNLQATVASYQEIPGASEVMKGVPHGGNPGSVGDRLSNAIVNPNLQVDPSIYNKDRRAREIEMMRRMNVKPISAKSTPGGSLQPIPAKPIIVSPAKTLKMSQNAPGNDVVPLGHVGNDVQASTSVNTVIPTWQPPATPSVSAPITPPDVLSVAGERPNPITTSVPLAPVVGGSGINNLNVSSTGAVFSQPPQGTASSSTSRVTGI